MTMRTPFTFVVIGSGNICQTYFNAIERIEEATIVGLVSRSKKRPDFLLSDIAVVTQLQDLQLEFDAVIIATPNGIHHTSAIAAAELGKHVLTEKPLDITVENMELMISACRKADSKLGVTFQHRMSPDNKILKEYISNDSFGRIYSADFTVRCWREQSYYDSGEWRGTWKTDGGGPFMQQACHELDLYTWFFGMPSEVHSFTDTFHHDIEVEDHGAALFRHENGMIGTFMASTVAYPGFPPTLTLHTEKGTVVVTNGKIIDWSIEGIANPSISIDAAIHSGAASAAVTDTFGHEAIITDFIEAVRQDRDPAVPGESARLGTELALRIYQHS